jgi:hypothetical protein
MESVVVSASRRTDSPAFHADWFCDRLQQGSMLWQKPFNRQTQWIGFDKTRVIVFWTGSNRPIC